MPNDCKKYALNQSPFYRLTTKKRLIKVLGITFSELKNLILADKHYIEQEEFKNDKRRLIERPKYKLKQIQRRIANLLSRIETPDFLFCPAKGRSYITNAKEHIDSDVVRSLDIKAYFQSTSSSRIYLFFYEQMQCSPDVAEILTNLATFRGHLPTGSPLSPILSYYAHADMWHCISNIAKGSACKLTVYMDDLTVSGINVSGKLLWKIKQQIHLYGLKYHKEKLYEGRKARRVTGVIIHKEQLKLPNRQQLKIYNLRQQIAGEGDSSKRAKLHQKLQGCAAQSKQISLSNGVKDSTT